MWYNKTWSVECGMDGRNAVMVMESEFSNQKTVNFTCSVYVAAKFWASRS